MTCRIWRYFSLLGRNPRGNL